MTDRNFILSQLMIFFALFFRYLSSGNPGFLVFCLGIVGVLISMSELINSNRIIYYAALSSIAMVQSIMLINTHLFKMTYLQNNEQYTGFAFGVIAYIVIIALLFKPNIFKENYKLNIYKGKSS